MWSSATKEHQSTNNDSHHLLTESSQLYIYNSQSNQANIKNFEISSRDMNKYVGRIRCMHSKTSRYNDWAHDVSSLVIQRSLLSSFDCKKYQEIEVKFPCPIRRNYHPTVDAKQISSSDANQNQDATSLDYLPQNIVEGDKQLHLTNHPNVEHNVIFKSANTEENWLDTIRNRKQRKMYLLTYIGDRSMEQILNMSREEWQHLLKMTGMKKNQVIQYCKNRYTKRGDITIEKKLFISDWIKDSKGLSLSEVAEQLDISRRQVALIKHRIIRKQKLEMIYTYLSNKATQESKDTKLSSEELNYLQSKTALRKKVIQDIAEKVHQNKSSIPNFQTREIIDAWKEWTNQNQDLKDVTLMKNHPFLVKMEKSYQISKSRISRLLRYHSKVMLRDRKIIDRWMTSHNRTPTEEELKFLQEKSHYSKRQILFIIDYSRHKRNRVTKDESRRIISWYVSLGRNPTTEELDEFSRALNLHKNQLFNVISNHKLGRKKRIASRERSIIYTLLKNNASMQELCNAQESLQLTSKQLRYLKNRYHKQRAIDMDKTNLMRIIKKKHISIPSSQSFSSSPSSPSSLGGDMMVSSFPQNTSIPKIPRITSHARFKISEWLHLHPNLQDIPENHLQMLKDETKLTFQQIRNVLNQIKRAQHKHRHMSK